MADPDDAALRRFLSRILLRSLLTDREQAAILRLRGTAARVAAHRDVVAPGQAADAACLVVDGLVAVFDQTADGQRQFTALRSAGDMCGLDAVVGPTAGCGLQAVSAANVLRVPLADLRALAAGQPGIAFAFWRDAAADASVLAKWVANLGRGDARKRLAHLFCEMGVRSERAGVGSRTDFPFPMTQTQLADASGLTAVHVNRTLQAMRGDGLVATGDRRVRVPNWSRLADAAEFDPGYLLLRRRPEPSAG